MKSKNIWVGAVFILAIILRCLFIDSRSIQYDDAFSIFLSRRPLMDIISGTAADTMPPLYYFLLHFWMKAGESLWYLRGLSVLLSLGAIVFLYFLVKEIFDDRAALFAVFFAAISPIQIYHAQDIRMYALLQLGQMGYAWSFVKIWKSNSKLRFQYWVVLILSGLIALYSHNLAGFVLIAPVFFLLYQKNWKLLFQLGGALMVMGLLFLPWALMLPGQFQKVQQAFWTPRPGLVEVIQVVIQFVANLPLPNIYLVGIAAVLGLQLMIIISLDSIRDKVKRNEKWLMIIFLTTSPVITFVISYLIRPIFVARGLLVSTLFIFALAGWILTKHIKDFIGWFVLLAFSAGSMIGLPYQMTFNAFPRSPFEEAADYLKVHETQNVRIVNDNKLSYFPIHYFSPELSQTFIMDEPGTPNDTFALGSQKAMLIFPEKDMDQAVNGAQGVYFIVFEQTLNEYQQLGYKDHPGIEWLNQHYQTMEKVNFNDLIIYHFNRPKN